MKNLKKYLLLGATLFFLLCFFFFPTKKEEAVEEFSFPEAKEEGEKWMVDIKGAIEKPGVYEVSSTTRVIDVITLAGGLKKDANTDFLNLSRKVEDGDIIWIYTEKEIAALKEGKTTIEYVQEACHCPDVQNSACLSTDTSTTNSSKVNINTASKEELMSLSGIGESKAEAILAYRKKTKFQTIEDIKKVSGIGDSVFEKIKEHITV